MSEMSEKGAKISRGRMRGSANKKLATLQVMFGKLEAMDARQVTILETEALKQTLRQAEESLKGYEEAIDRCLLIEDKELDPGDEHAIESEEISDKLDTLRNKTAGFLARIKEEQNVRTRENNAQGGTQTQAGNMGRVTAKPPPYLGKDVSLDEFETWLSTWRDYYSVTKLDKEANSTQRANLKSYLTQEMRGIVEYVLGIGEDTTKSCEEILKDIRAHIRSNRNIQIDKVSFERRSQQQGESFDDYVVTIRRMARNADLCKVCLDDRLLTKIMSGIVDQDVREELLAMVPPPKLDAAIVFARSKEAARRSNMDLTGRTVQQIKGRDRLRSRSESPVGLHRRDRSQDRSRSRPKCYFCADEECFARDDTCLAFGTKCPKCGLRDHFKNSFACQKGWMRRSIKPRQGQSRSGRAVQVRGLTGSKRAPMAKINVKTFDGKKYIGTGMFYPDSAADCTIMGQHLMKRFGMHQQNLEPPDPEGIDAANKSPFTMIGSLKVTFEYHGRFVQDVIHVVEEETDLLISWDTCIEFGILSRNYPNPINEEPIGVRGVSTSVENETHIEENGTHGEENGTSKRGNRHWKKNRHKNRNENVMPTEEYQDSGKLAQKLISMIGNKDEPSQSDLKKIKDVLMKEYSDVFSVEEELKPMRCEPMRIELKEGAIPTQVSTPRKIGPSMKPKTKKELDDMEKKGIIEFVSADHATEWCHPFCPREKPNGGIRPTVDLKGLNEWVKRPAYPVTSPHEAAYDTTPGSRFFTVMDAKNGYHQIPLHEDSRDLTTFMTPWGRYRFTRGPQGCNATGDKYNCEVDKAIAGIKDVAKVVDDIKTANPGIKEHIERVIEILERCRQHGITLSPNKFVFAQPEITFAGFKIGREGIRADPAKLKAMIEFPRPTNVSELRSFEGMVNQVGHFSTEISEAQGVLRELRQKKNMFSWGDAHDKAFEAVKTCLTRLQTLTLFDPELETRIETDGSKLKGLGYSLQQFHGRGCKCKCTQQIWKSIQCGSRFLSETESRYAPIEFEALGVAWGVNKCRYFLTGLPEFIIRNDHRTLIPILNNKSLNEIDNPRLQRLVEKLRPYRYRAEHVSGVKNCIADALSRAPVDQPMEEDLLGEEASKGIRQIVRRAASCAGIDDDLQETLADPNIERIKDAAKRDTSYQELLENVRNGFPNKICDAPGTVRPYFGVRDELSEHSGLVILRSCRIIIPTSLRKDILKRLHASHQGIERTQRRARETVYWPGIGSDITNTVASCCICSERLPSQQKEPMKTDPRPERPFEQTATDLFDWAGKTYIVYVDRYSGWPCVHMWTSTPTSRRVIEQIKKWFIDWGVPLRIRSDGGPQYDSSEYREFLQAWGVNPPGLSTPTYAQSNGRAEAAVKAMKTLVQKATINGDITCDEFQRGLLEWRNTPKEHGKSPSELVFGCQMRSVVPSLKTNLIPKWKVDIEDKIAELQKRSERNYNIGARSLEELQIGDQVRVQNAISKRWDDVGEVMRKGNHRDYVVRIPGRRLKWRNRRFLRLIEEERGRDGGVDVTTATARNTEINGRASKKRDVLNSMIDEGHSSLRRGNRERKQTVRFNM